jgi:hypothetical protein
VGLVDFRAAYLADIVRTFRKYRTLAESAMTQVSDADLHATLDADDNSIAIVVKHVAGNLRSRFTDFLTSDGEKPDRHRDTEFEIGRPPTRDEMLGWWNTGWSTALGSIEALTPEHLDRQIFIRGEGMLVHEALDRSVTHTAYHVGQIVFLAKHFAGPGWKSLTIPKRKNPAI